MKTSKEARAAFRNLILKGVGSDLRLESNDGYYLEAHRTGNKAKYRIGQIMCYGKSRSENFRETDRLMSMPLNDALKEIMIPERTWTIVDVHI